MAARIDRDLVSPRGDVDAPRGEHVPPARCPVAHGGAPGVSLCRHRDVMRALLDHDSFSNRVSAHRAVPNGMDPPEHTEYRRIIEPFFTADRVGALEPVCREIAAGLLATAGGEVEVMSQLAEDFALRSQCAFLGWSANSHAPLRHWMRRNHEAIRARDRARISALATEFDTHIRQVLTQRRTGIGRGNDVTSELLDVRVQGRPLTDEEIVSVLRNWTVGELGTIAASVGILVYYLAEHPALQRELRAHPERLPAAIDEILRIDAPLRSSRRVTATDVRIDGHDVPRGERVALLWGAANRDEDVFGAPGEFRLDRDPALNLLYGAGIHVCPGAPLARLELRVFVEELFASTQAVETIAGRPAVRANEPAGGFATAPVRLLNRS